MPPRTGKSSTVPQRRLGGQGEDHRPRQPAEPKRQPDGTFSQLTDDELRFEVASMINEARAIKGQPPLALPGQPHEDERKH
ncbi:hypothetical protein [Mesorhizobium sp. WSM3879]|uniref:hypothetical protein n=1 Tax=Mesorhizobium sp. WSM3879 TaxID=2029406 RepID=UPI001180BAD5|nr:hypothetical protein [Mesorhizobium sp. WSM3879]